MMAICPVCSKRTCIHWPEHWVYRRGETFYCSEQCMDVDMVRDMNLLKQVRMERRKRKMARYKKDGTPAKKPGPRAKKPEIPEPVSGGPWEKAEVPEQTVVKAPETEEKMPINRIGYTICGIEGEFGRFFYDRKFNRLDWTTPDGEEVSMDPVHWRIFVKQMPRVLEVLMAEAVK